MKAKDLDECEERISRDIDVLNMLISASGLKEEAGRAFASDDLDLALDNYTKALSVDPTLVTALANRAACQLATNDFKGCIDSCTTAVEFLSRRKNEFNLKNLSTVLSPSPQVRRKWVITLLCRRAAAKRQVGDFAGALKDFKDGRQTLGTGDSESTRALEKDIESIKQEMGAIR